MTFILDSGVGDIYIYIYICIFTLRFETKRNYDAGTKQVIYFKSQVNAKEKELVSNIVVLKIRGNP